MKRCGGFWIRKRFTKSHWAFSANAIVRSREIAPHYRTLNVAIDSPERKIVLQPHQSVLSRRPTFDTSKYCTMPEWPLRRSDSTSWSTAGWGRVCHGGSAVGFRKKLVSVKFCWWVVIYAVLPTRFDQGFASGTRFQF